MTLKQVEERVTEIESAVELILKRLEVLERKFQPFDDLITRVENAESRLTIHEISVEDKMKEAGTETDSKVLTSELRSEEKIKEIGEKFKETVDKLYTIELKVNDWPTPAAEDYTLVTNKRNERKLRLSSLPVVKQSHAEKYKDKPKDTIVLLGDSLTRGVGVKLEYQSNMASTICRPGAHIDDITVEVSKLGDNADRHVVLLVGTNDIKREDSVNILKKYRNMLGETQKIKNRKVSVVGIPRRANLDNFDNSRRIGVNSELKEMCATLNVEFLEYEPSNNRLARDGLHLNDLGQNELGLKIYQHCGRFLV